MKILFLVEKESEIKLFESILEDAFINFESRIARSEKEFIRQANHNPDIILSAYSLPKFSVNEALAYLKKQHLSIAFVFITDGITEEKARSYIEKGADDYVSKSNIHHLPAIINNAIKKKNAERKKLDEEMIMKESEEKLHTIFENEPDCIFQIGLNGELIEMNPAALELTEASSKIKFGKSKLWDFIHEGDIKKIKSYHQSICRGNKKDFTFRFVGSKGTPRWIATRAVPLRDSEHYVTSALLFGRDITDNITASEELRKSEEKFKMLAEYSPFGIYQIDAEGKCFYVNKKWCELSGYSFEEALGENWKTMIHPDDKSRVTEEWKLFITGVAPFNSEYRFLTKDGEVLWVSGNASVLKNEKNEITEFIGTVNDITAIR